MFIFVYEYFIRVRLMWKSIYKFRSSRSIERLSKETLVQIIICYSIVRLFITVLILKVNYFLVYYCSICKIFYYRHGIIIVLEFSQN